jgi:uncharacterized protein (DUF342 family)
MVAKEQDQSVDVGRKLISEVNDEAYDLRIESLHNQLECRASIKVHTPENSISPAELISLLNDFDISDSLDLEQLAVFCTAAANGEDPQDFLLATGRQPTTGKDGYFELFVDTGEDEIELQEDEHGRVDFKNIQAFTNVEPEQLIGTIYPPEKGDPGKTITGLPIPSQMGHPARLSAGDGVEIRENGTKTYATKAGRVTFDKQVLAVTEEFVVTGDVDLKVGHINFNGFVDIKGDVLDDFNIKSSKGIKISGAVGACLLDSDGPITIGTMAGMGLGMIRCRGDLTAGYLNQVTVECWGNVHVKNEIRNSIIKATGVISAPKGLITGGQAISLEGIEAKTFGSKSGIKTYLTAGVYFPETDRLHFLRTRLKSIAYQLKRISQTLPMLHKKPLDEMRNALREAIELRIGILTQRQVNLTEEREKLSDELTTFQIKDHPTANAKINALTSIEEGVIINLGETTDEFKTEFSGPVSIIENLQQGGLRYLSHSALKISAEQLEEEIQQNETATDDEETESL